MMGWRKWLPENECTQCWTATRIAVVTCCNATSFCNHCAANSLLPNPWGFPGGPIMNQLPMLLVCDCVCHLINKQSPLSSPPPRQTGSPSKKRHKVWNWFVDEETLLGRKGRHKVRAYCLKCLDVHLELLCESNDTQCYEQCEWAQKTYTNHTDRIISVHN